MGATPAPQRRDLVARWETSLRRSIPRSATCHGFGPSMTKATRAPRRDIAWTLVVTTQLELQVSADRRMRPPLAGHEALTRSGGRQSSTASRNSRPAYGLAASRRVHQQRARGPRARGRRPQQPRHLRPVDAGYNPARAVFGSRSGMVGRLAGDGFTRDHSGGRCYGGCPNIPSAVRAGAAPVRVRSGGGSWSPGSNRVPAPSRRSVRRACAARSHA
jgi:hypothetical protein